MSLIVDSFAGGGGASTGLEWALGRPVDIAINHDREAIAMHRANHPGSRHFCEDVFDVDPVEATAGEPVELAWFSPDCTHHSKARGAKPFRDKRRANRSRGLAWVVVKWARAVRPRVICLENVEEFADWGPLDADNKLCPRRKGLTFRRWRRRLENLGYRVELRQIRACDYGTPTIRKRLFIIARCDGEPIVWPAPTHGPGLLPYHTAAECIDWSIPCPSIFERKRPLAENTMRRIARGIQRFVLDNPNPYIVTYYGGDDRRGQPVDEPLRTQGTANRHGLVLSYFVPRHGEHAKQKPRSRSVEEPMPTVTATSNGASLVSAFLAKHYGGHETPGTQCELPFSTITAKDHHAVVATHLINQKGTQQQCRDLNDPVPTICASTVHAGLVAALMAPYYGSGSGETGRDLFDPAPTVTSKDRLQLVTVNIDGETYVLTDIGMRMLQPRELFLAQGFPADYQIDIEVDGRRLSKAAQVRMCGNSVCPQVVEALVRANVEDSENTEQAVA